MKFDAKDLTLTTFSKLFFAALLAVIPATVHANDQKFLQAEATFAAKFCLDFLESNSLDTSFLVERGYKKATKRKFKRTRGKLRLTFEVADRSSKRSWDNCSLKIDFPDTGQIERAILDSERAIFQSHEAVIAGRGYTAERRKKPGFSARIYQVKGDVEITYTSKVEVTSLARYLSMGMGRRR